MINEYQHVTSAHAKAALGVSPLACRPTSVSMTGCVGGVQKAAFSLVELSIVLVILGLLTGGILTGQNLIRASELRAVTTEFSSFQTAAMSFKDKYMGLPGDMRNATKFWGAMTNCGVASPSGTGTQTCDGDGDGQIEAASAVSRTGEMFGLWRQLANAGMVEGQFDGIAGSGGVSHSVIRSDVPGSKVGNAGWAAIWAGEVASGDTARFAGSYGNVLDFGAQSTTTTTSLGVLSPEEAWGIDSKIDDAKPQAGKVRAREDLSGTGTTHCSNTTTTEYALTNTGALCALTFLKAF